jgi:hypothetical protein
MGPDEWNPNGPHYGGNGYHNGPMYSGRDRGPPGPPRRYDDRRGPPPPDTSRQPQWRQDNRRPPPPSNGHGLPPPPVNLPRRPDVVMPPNRDPPQPPPIAVGGARGGGAPNVDTYIPSYSGRSNDAGDRGRRGSRDSYRDPDAAPPPRSYRGEPPRASYRDMDGPPVQRDPYRERDSHGGHDRSRRTRSRSPEHHDDRRARLQNREKDFYAR